MFGTVLDMHLPTDNDVRKSARDLFERREDMRAALGTKDIVFFSAPEGTIFRVSDRPVVTVSSLPFGDVGVSSHGVAIFFPLGQRLMLGMLCPSIGRKLNKAPLELPGVPELTRRRLAALQAGIAAGEVVELDAQEVQRHNHQQMAGSSRFVYGPTEDFRDLEALLLAHPQYRDVRTTIGLGKIGEGPAPRRDMPMGSWIVLFGQTTTHMLSVSDINNDKQFEATAEDHCHLRQAIADGPFIEMRYFVDQRERRGMRDVTLVLVRDEKPGRLQVRHSDPALDALIQSLGPGFK